MHIAFVTLGFDPIRMSGLDISGERLVRGLIDAGHNVTVIAGTDRDFREPANHPSLEIHRIPLGRSNWIGFAMRAASKLSRLDRTANFDAIHFWDVHFAFAFRGRYVASLHQSFRQRVAALRYANTTAPQRLIYLVYYSMARWLMEVPSTRRARGLLAVSAATRDEFISQYRVSPALLALTRHGIDTVFFQRVRSIAFRNKLGIAADRPVIVFAGFVTPRKGLDHLARALALIQPAPCLVIAGKWSPGYRDRFIALAGSSAAQVLEAGFVRDAEMPALYSLADVYVSPSLLEGFGLTLAEALACGTPVVAADAGAVREVVGPGGILVPPASADALAHAISYLLAHPEIRHELAQRGREHIVNNFSVQTMIAATLASYRQFI